MATKKTEAAPIVVPSLEEAYPEYGVLLARRRELDEVRSRLEKEIRGIRRGRVPAPLVHEASERRRARAAELLGDLVDGSESIIATPKRDEVEDQLQRLRDELESVEAALAIIATRIPQAQSAASRIVCQRVAEPYRAIVERMVSALLAAYEAHAEITEIRETLEANDVAYVSGLPTPVATPMMGHPLSRDSRFANWVRDAVATGYLDWANVPERLK